MVNAIIERATDAVTLPDLEATPPPSSPTLRAVHASWTAADDGLQVELGHRDLRLDQSRSRVGMCRRVAHDAISRRQSMARRGRDALIGTGDRGSHRSPGAGGIRPMTSRSSICGCAMSLPSTRH
jgi:hypothetical protein